jgi:hypothetical protein
VRIEKYKGRRGTEVAVPWQSVLCAPVRAFRSRDRRGLPSSSSAWAAGRSGVSWFSLRGGVSGRFGSHGHGGGDAAGARGEAVPVCGGGRGGASGERAERMLLAELASGGHPSRVTQGQQPSGPGGKSERPRSARPSWVPLAPGSSRPTGGHAPLASSRRVCSSSTVVASSAFPARGSVGADSWAFRDSRRLSPAHSGCGGASAASQRRPPGRHLTERPGCCPDAAARAGGGGGRACRDAASFPASVFVQKS